MVSMASALPERTTFLQGLAPDERQRLLRRAHRCMDGVI